MQVATRRRFKTMVSQTQRATQIFLKCICRPRPSRIRVRRNFSSRRPSPPPVRLLSRDLYCGENGYLDFSFSLLFGDVLNPDAAARRWKLLCSDSADPAHLLPLVTSRPRRPLYQAGTPCKLLVAARLVHTAESRTNSLSRFTQNENSIDLIALQLTHPATDNFLSSRFSRWLNLTQRYINSRCAPEGSLLENDDHSLMRARLTSKNGRSP